MRIDAALILPGLFYPVAPNVKHPPIQQAYLGDTPYAVYRGKNNCLTVHSDVCPHMQAHLSSGWLTKEGGITCPYHGFVFKGGRFCGIHGTECKGEGGRQVLKPVTVYEDKDLVYMATTTQGHTTVPPPYYPPEACDKSFRVVTGYRDLEVPQQQVTENLLDLLHISFVHSFGNPHLPLARNIKFTQTGDFSGRTTFSYVPRSSTLSSILAGNAAPLVEVENEYYLPSTTITRVRIGNDVKVVLTRAQPKTSTTTRLYWQLYRNFYTSNILDYGFNVLMDITIDEDAWILSRTYSSKPCNVLPSPYDVTIDAYRRSLEVYKAKFGVS